MLKLNIFILRKKKLFQKIGIVILGILCVKGSDFYNCKACRDDFQNVKRYVSTQVKLNSVAEPEKSNNKEIIDLTSWKK